MEPFFLSAFIIAVSEMGDKTQLVALCLATRYRKPAPVIMGILAATLLSNLVAALLGQYIGVWLQGKILHGLLGASFISAAIWAFIPDKVEECEEAAPGRGIFLASFTGFLIAEMGDKTQLAAAALAAQFHMLAGIVLGTTLGMMIANLPAIFFGYKIMALIPLKTVRLLSGGIFAALGIYELSNLI